MALNFYDKVDNTSRGFVGAGGQLNIRDKTSGKYHLFIPTETLPAVVGSTDTVETDFVTSASKGLIQGKRSTESKDITFLWNRDDLLRLMEHNNEFNEYLVSYPDGTGWKFSGTYSIKPEDVNASDKATGTFTIVANDSDDEPTIDVSDLLMRTCIISSKVDSDTLLGDSAVTIKLENNIEGVTYKAEVLTGSSSHFSATISGDTLSIKKNTGTTSGETAVIKVTASKSGCADWFVTTRAIVQ